jgi:hypothetical protein
MNAVGSMLLTVAVGVIERHLRPESIRKVELVRDTSLAPGQEGAAA